MNDSVLRLLANIEPRISKIQENRIEIKSLSEVYKTISEIIDLGKKSYLEILDYYDQEFIIRCIKIHGRNTKNLINKYKTSRYLLKNRDKNMQELPQFKDSILYMESLFKYLYSLYEKIKIEYTEKSDNLKTQELLSKYYIILKKESIFIEDSEEFLTFLDLAEIDNADRLNILIFINKCNVKVITKGSSLDKILANNINLNQIKDMLDENKSLIDNTLKLEKVTESIITEGKLNQAVLAKKKKYLINKISRTFEEAEYDGLLKYYLDYKTLLDYEKEFKKQKASFKLDDKKKLIFMMSDNVSLVRHYLDTTSLEYKSPILKNLLDIEKERDLQIPDYSYNGIYLYIKKEFIVKTVYTYLDNGYVLVLGVMDKGENLKTFLNKNGKLITRTLLNKKNLELNDTERNEILKNIRAEDLVLTIDLNTLDIEMEDKNAR